eukprot:4363901-Lingulodinium_polyedra.AAC.1
MRRHLSTQPHRSHDGCVSPLCSCFAGCLFWQISCSSIGADRLESSVAGCGCALVRFGGWGRRAAAQ